MTTEFKPLALIVEDTLSLALLFTEAIEQAGYKVEAQQHGTIAQARLKQITPQLVILDMHLPGVDGETILRGIRADERLATTHVIVTTADSSLGANVSTLANQVLIKPVGFIQLRDLAKRLRAQLVADQNPKGL